MEMQRQFSDCFLWIEEEVNSPKIKSQLSVGGISQLCGVPIESLDFIKVWISKNVGMDFDTSFCSDFFEHYLYCSGLQRFMWPSKGNK